MDPNLITMIVAGLAFVAVAAAGFAFAGPTDASGMTKRAKTMGAATAAAANQTDGSSRRRQANADALKNLADTQKTSRKRQDSVSGRIAQAGLNLPESAFWIGSAALGGGLFAVPFFLGAPVLVCAGLGAVGGLGLPRWVLGFMISGRQKKFVSQLAEGLDVIVRGVKSGLPLNQCLQIVGKESPEPLRSEFQSLVDGQAMGLPLEQALHRMYDRMPLPEVNFFNIVLIIQQKAGGNLSEALGNLSTVLRARKMLKEKIKALSAEAKMSAMIIGAMPFVVMGILAVIRPEYLMLLFTTEAGRVVLLVCAFMMSLGVWVMRNMINFKF
jgi:tight adherence protein B